MFSARNLLLMRPNGNYCLATRKRDVRRGKRRSLAASLSSSSQKQQQETVKEEPQQRKGLLYRMAPPKGGTDPPDAKFLVIASVVSVAGYYAWFVDPPAREDQ